MHGEQSQNRVLGLRIGHAEVAPQFVAQRGIGIIVGCTETSLGSHLSHGLHDGIPSRLHIVLVIFVIAGFVANGEVVEQVGIMVVDMLGLRHGIRDVVVWRRFSVHHLVLQPDRIDDLDASHTGKAEQFIKIFSGGRITAFHVDGVSSQPKAFDSQRMIESNEWQVVFAEIMLALRIGLQHRYFITQPHIIGRNGRSFHLVIHHNPDHLSRLCKTR